MVGKIIDGFELIDFKGKGSFGSVYQCRKNEQIYAMKIFSADFVFDEFSKGEDNRVTREIEALKIVNSVFVVKYIFDGNFTDNGWKYYYVVMDYVEGEDLENALKSRAFSEEEVKRIFASILQGVDAIHNAKLIHRDLKPANIYLLQDGSVKILDFGLSKLIDFTSITNTGDQLGTPLYMSPEQISDSKNIDYRSDYYALGVIFFKLLSNATPYGHITSREELYYKIKVEPPMSIRTLLPTVDNSVDNLIELLLQKENYRRPNTVNDILKYLSVSEGIQSIQDKIPFIPSFFVRLWNEKKVLEDFYGDGFSIEHAVFPINHQDRQKNLLNFLKKENVDFIIDPSTMRLAYDSYSDVKGLISLPYAPANLSRLELDDLGTYQQKQRYVKLVVDEQLKHNPPHIASPFHVSNNSNLVKIKMDNSENWFSLDIKLANETREYLSRIDYKGNFISGFCIKTDVLTTRTEKEYFLNVLSSLSCDEYWVYVDCIDNNSNFSQLYNYATTLLELQKATHKPVVAGRVGAFGLVLLAFGLFGFESGTSRFESFYEDLYKEVADPYNMYARYYFPELLSNVAIERKNPAKIIQLLASKTGHDIGCTCPYCNGKPPASLVDDGLTRKHFLYRRNLEIEELRHLNSTQEKVDYIEERVTQAIQNYKNLKPIFKDDDYRFLKVWLDVIKKLREEWL
ncbi:serine/threonine-protein kinase [uncultured Oscillibacter sp.]|uniref:serine/threonine protein kinase n=1 Tax=uncultured Oscillibacter sp. TaxID=876091 RepID=UPI0025DD6165|nr:serine/threonine-protein kinase [uncultured Oscillibacter sp.]